MNDMKLKRAAQIVARIFELDAERGTTVPARIHRGKLARLVEDRPEWSVWITKGYRMAFAPVYACHGKTGRTDFGQRQIEDRDWILIELEDSRRRPVFAASVRGDEVDLFRFIPGKWERSFGVDNDGDCVPFDKVEFPRPDSPELKTLLESPDARLPPQRTGPVADDKTHEALLRERARRKRWRVAI
ncbi:hypothetical protein [Sphingosinicella sp. LY1275]|uniref:hypothetical protein n=1 Tax=Sphingosinicella sp. LY1275 TaxID=3095379 RepID=UPI002ADEE79C|nr:hypothetical protein [Sphingosinicella sp. LY1275]MEA1015148.1 hypothetical protein [Sphingosinicella sp. LY1275]